jgi:hypothetical protein
MKFVAIVLTAAFVAFLLQKAATQTDWQTAMASPPFIILTNQNFQWSKTAPVLLADTQPAQPLKPGIYQTYPYAMTLVVPEPANDDCKMKAQRDVDPKMPVFRPKVEVVPESSAAE